jgi:hypothetical protein
MRTVNVNIFKFDELPEDIQAKVITDNYDFNVDHGWWDSTYEDAENSGIKLEGFDLGRARSISGEFTGTAYECADHIIANHGVDCDTHKTALEFKKEIADIRERYKDTGEDDWDEQSEIENAEDEFKKSLLQDYWKILQKEYEYLTSDEQIKEALIANEYDYTQDGKRFTTKTNDHE